MKQRFLGILRNDTVRNLTEHSEATTSTKESKNNGVGMKNKRLKTEINNIITGMNHSHVIKDELVV